jgi:transcriptional regulator
MWIPSFYKITDEKVIQEFISAVGLATLITNDNPFPMATHAPMELECDNDGNKYLRGHIAMANPQSELLKKEPNVLAIFQSSIHHYISSSWYEKPNAPTWNYMSVHFCLPILTRIIIAARSNHSKQEQSFKAVIQ